MVKGILYKIGVHRPSQASSESTGAYSKTEPDFFPIVVGNRKAKNKT